MGRVTATAVAGALALGWLVGGAPGTPVATAGAGVVVPPSSIDATGTQDVTAALSSFFASRPPNSTVELPRGARYRAEGVVTITDANGLTIEGNGATIFATTDGSGAPPPPVRGARAHWPRLRRHLEFDGGTNIVVHDLVVEGPNASAAYDPKLEGQAAFAFAGVAHGTLSGVTVRNVYGDGVYVAGASSNVSVLDSHFDGIGRQGVAIVAASNVTVRANTLSRVARSVADIEPLGRAAVVHVHVTGNTVGSFTNYLLAEQGGGTAVDDVWVDHNVVAGGNGIAVLAGIRTRRRTGLHVDANTSRVPSRVPVQAPHPEPIYVVNVQDVEIRDNTSPMTGGTAIGLDGACVVSVSGNRFTGAATTSRTDAPCGALPVGKVLPAPATKPRRSVGPAGRSATTAAPRQEASPPRRAPSPSGSSSDTGAWLLAGALSLVAAAFGASRVMRERRAPLGAMTARPPGGMQ